MPREKAGYRDNLELLNMKFPDKEMLDIREVMSFTGMCYNTVKKYIVFGPGNRVTKADLARQVSI